MNKRLGVVYGFYKGVLSGNNTDELFGQLSVSLTKRHVITEKVGILDCALIIKNNSLKIINLITGEDLAVLDGLYFVNWRNHLEMAKALGVYMRRQGKMVVTHEITRQLPLTKVGELIELSDKDLPLPDTYIVRNKYLLKMAKKHSLPFEFPFIMKAAGASKGESNYLVRSVDMIRQAVAEFPDETFLLQKYIPNNFDYRIIILGGKACLAILRSRLDDSTHLNNTSQGADGELVNIKDIKPEILLASEKAAHAVGRDEFAGVDVIVDSQTGDFYILEVNKTPQIETGTNVDPKIEALTKYLAYNLGDAK